MIDAQPTLRRWFRFAAGLFALFTIGTVTVLLASVALLGAITLRYAKQPFDPQRRP
jgi:hypothetical protein